MYKETLCQDIFPAKIVHKFPYKMCAIAQFAFPRSNSLSSSACRFRSGINIKAAQLILGNNTPDMVMKVYANLDKSDVLKGSQSFADSMDLMLGVIPHSSIG